MSDPKEALSIVKKILTYLKDVKEMATRIAKLSEIAEANDDGRIRCANCKTGRLENFVGHGIYSPTATCNHCGQTWLIDPVEMKICGVP